MKRLHFLLLIMITACNYPMHQQPLLARVQNVVERTHRGLLYGMPYAVPVAAWAAKEHLCPELHKRGMINPKNPVGDFLLFNASLPAIATIQQYENRKEVLREQRYNKLSYLTPAAIAIALGILSSSDSLQNALWTNTVKNIPALGYAVYAMWKEKKNDEEYERLAREREHLTRQRELGVTAQEKKRFEMEHYKERIPEVVSLTKPWVRSKLSRYKQKQIACGKELLSQSKQWWQEILNTELLAIDRLMNNMVTAEAYTDITQFNNVYDDLLCAYNAMQTKGQSADEGHLLTPFELIYAHTILNVLSKDEEVMLIGRSLGQKEALLVKLMQNHKENIDSLLHKLFLSSGNFAVDLHNFAAHTDESDVYVLFEHVSKYVIQTLQRRIIKSRPLERDEAEELFVRYKEKLNFLRDNLLNPGTDLEASYVKIKKLYQALQYSFAQLQPEDKKIMSINPYYYIYGLLLAHFIKPSVDRHLDFNNLNDIDIIVEAMENKQYHQDAMTILARSMSLFRDMKASRPLNASGDQDLQETFALMQQIIESINELKATSQ